MIRLALRCTPTRGAADLRWLAGLTASLDAICDFLLRAEITDELVRDRDLPPDELARVVDGRAAQEGSPVVHLREGAVVLELAVRLADSTLPARVLASVGLLFTKGPALAAWPGHVRAAWFSARKEAEVARDAYERIVDASRVEVVVDDTSRPRRRKGKGSKRGAGSRNSEDLAGSTRVAPPLDR